MGEPIVTGTPPTPRTYERRPQQVEAMQVHSKDSILAIADWLVNGHGITNITLHRTSVSVGFDPHEKVRARKRDWLVLDTATGKVQVIPDAEFRDQYDPAGDANQPAESA